MRLTGKIISNSALTLDSPIHGGYRIVNWKQLLEAKEPSLRFHKMVGRGIALEEIQLANRAFGENDMGVLLSEIPLFCDLPEKARMDLAGMMKANWYDKEKVILREGERGNQVYVIVKGSVKIFKNNNNPMETILTTAGHGEVFGEMAILDSLPRSANVAALEDTLVFSLKREDFLSFLTTNPEATLKLIASISIRLRYTNELVIQHRQMEEKMRYIGHHDSLTGLFNRAFLHEELQRLEQTSFQSGLIVCDVDGLKLVNDTLGHETGDRLLITAASIIGKCFRESDVVARIGGDEFAVLLPNSPENIVKRGSHRIQDLVAQYNASNPMVPLGLSVGFAVRENQTTTISQLFEEADTKMYRHKMQNSQGVRIAILQNLMRNVQSRASATGQGHYLRNLAAQLGKAAGLNDQKLADLDLFIQFHDIGFVSIPEQSPLGYENLSREETVQAQRHCEIGFRITQSIPEMSSISDWILKHHEWWNGKGYPLGVKGEEIPLPCRILAICDAFHSITNNGSHGNARPPEEAIAELQKWVNIKYDPILMKTFSLLIGNQ